MTPYNVSCFPKKRRTQTSYFVNGVKFREVEVKRDFILAYLSIHDFQN